MIHPYRAFTAELARLLADARRLPAGGFAPCTPAPPPPEAPLALLLSPHPDDESITGALPLRLLRQAGHRVEVVAVTLGSRASRRAERLEELRGACAFLGFGLHPLGLTGITPEAREEDPGTWAEAVRSLAELLRARRPRTLLLPHAKDQNRTHMGTHQLGMEALGTLPGLACLVVETEFWGAMEAPNLLVESTPDEVGDLVAAISFHRGEVARNPYHARLPAWMADNVRRGGELVGGQGGAAPDFAFATLYRLSRWRGGHLEAAFPGGRMLPAADDPSTLFGA